MKRIVALLTVLSILVLSGLTAFAASGDVLTMTVPETCTPGSTVTMTFGVVKDTNVSAMNLEVSYDTDTFEYVSYENGEVISDAIAAGNCTQGKFLFALATLTPITAEGSLFTVTFKVDSKATGDHEFFFYSTGFSKEDGTEIPVNTVKKVVKIEGTNASEVSVTPVYSTDDTGSSYVVSASEEPTDPITAPGGNSSNSGTVSDGKDSSADETKGNNKWIWAVAVIVLAVGAAALLVAASVARKKETPMENQSILDDQGKAMLGYEENNEN